MNLENHEHAKRLLRAARIEGVSPEDSQWLIAHVAVCAACSSEAAALDSAIGALRTFGVAASPHVVRRASFAVHRRAEQLRHEKAQTAPLWIAAALSVVLAVLTMPYAWSTFRWLGRLLQVSDVIWQVAFLMWWFLPATVLGAVASCRSVRTAEMEWRSV